MWRLIGLRQPVGAAPFAAIDPGKVLCHINYDETEGHDLTFTRSFPVLHNPLCEVVMVANRRLLCVQGSQPAA